MHHSRKTLAHPLQIGFFCLTKSVLISRQNVQQRQCGRKYRNKFCGRLSFGENAGKWVTSWRRPALRVGARCWLGVHRVPLPESARVLPVAGPDVDGRRGKSAKAGKAGRAAERERAVKTASRGNSAFRVRHKEQPSAAARPGARSTPSRPGTRTRPGGAAPSAAPSASPAAYRGECTEDAVDARRRGPFARSPDCSSFRAHCRRHRSGPRRDKVTCQIDRSADSRGTAGARRG